MRLRLVCMSFCLVLLLAGFLWASHKLGIKDLKIQDSNLKSSSLQSSIAGPEAFAAIKYRLGTGDEIDFTAITKTNQGAGSGLDADKLDGLNSTAFLQSSSSASNTFDLGDGQNNTNKIYKFNIGGANLPGVRYNAQTGKVQVSHDGTSWSDIGSGSATLTVEKVDAVVSSSASTLDFSSKFNITESPAGEANIDLASGGVSSIEITDGTIANADVATNAAIAESKLSLNYATHSNANDPTAGEKAALAGTSGTPSGTNKYVTDSDARNTNARIPTAHASTHASSGADALSGNLDSTARVTVRKNTGTDTGSRRRLNLIEGTNITLTTTDDPTNEEVDVTIASSGGSSGVAVQDRDVTEVEVVNTVTETSVYSYSVPGNTLGTNKMLRLTAILDYINNSGVNRNFTIRVKYGGTTIGTLNTTIGSDTVRYPFRLDAFLIAENATNAQRSHVTVLFGAVENLGAGAGNQGPYNSGHRNIAEDSTVAKTLEVTFEHSAAATTISAKMYSVILELL